MDRSITIKEQRQAVWKTGTYISAALAVILGIIFWNITSPLWVGIFRLAAFIFFSLTVFGLLKSMQTPLAITISWSPEHLLVDYHQGEKVVQEEQFERSSIQGFSISTDTPAGWLPFIHSESGTVEVTFNDGHQDLNLFEYSGRTLFFEETEIREVLNFLQSQDNAPQPQESS